MSDQIQILEDELAVRLFRVPDRAFGSRPPARRWCLMPRTL
uniref:Uncharacterized protein n=1 Tax=Bosea sp. NBC_00436 TaxID=2969620 RepID=A0A9E8CT37_9HYPH